MASTLSGPSQRRIFRAQSAAGARKSSTLTHLRRGWIPVSQRVLAEARVLLERTPEKREQLFSLISNDISLCVHVNGELMKTAERTRLSEVAERIATSSTADLLSALPRQVHQVSKHDLRKISPAQSGQLQRTLVAQKTAQAIASRAGLSSSEAVIGALFADLGRQLVAWNYPVIFSRALLLQKTGSGDLDSEIEKMLGFNPRKISSQLAPQYGLSQELQLALTRLTTPDKYIDRRSNASYSDIFNYARAFSEHLDGKNFAHQDAQFEVAQSSLRDRIGELPSAQEIEEQLAESLSYFQDVIPNRLRLALAGWQQMVVSPESNPLTLDALHIRVPDSIAPLVSDLIRTVEGAGDTVRAFGKLVEQVVPQAGFESGCMYLLSRDKETLIPQLNIGSFATTSPAAVGINSGSDLAKALFSSTPLKSSLSRALVGGTQVRYTLGFQSPQVDGVLVLCAPEGNSNQVQAHDQLNCFRAIHALLEMILKKDYELRAIQTDPKA